MISSLAAGQECDYEHMSWWYAATFDNSTIFEGRAWRCGSSKRQQPHCPQMTPITRHQPYDLRRWPLSTFLPLYGIERIRAPNPLRSHL